MVDSLPVAPGTRVLQLPFLTPLSNAGGTVALGGLFNFGEGSCGEPPCSSVTTEFPLRHIVQGQVIGTPVEPTPVPEPSTLALAGAGIAMAGARRFRRQLSNARR
jgi:hypothetical protein